MVSAASAAPALPISDSIPATTAAMANTVRLSAPALTSQSPPTTSSQLWMIAVAVRPARIEPAVIRPARWSAVVPSAAPARPVRMPASTSGSTLAASPAVAGETVTTSSTGALASAAAWLSSWATVALAAVAVSTLGPSGVATKAP